MVDEQNKSGNPVNSQINNQPTPETEKTPYELYLEEKTTREKLQETLNKKDTDYQRKLIGLERSISDLKGNLLKKDQEVEITKAKYWNDKDADYKEAVARRQNSEEGIIVSGIYEYLDKRAEEGQRLKQSNIFHI